MKILQLFLALFLLISLFLISAKSASAETNIFKPQLSWQRSTEAPDKIVQETIIGSKVNEALQMPLDPSQTVFDNGVSTPTVNKNAVAAGIEWASWIQYSAPSPTVCGTIFELRRFQANFNLPTNFNSSQVKKVSLRSPYYAGDIFPINDNAYIHINGNFAKRLGTNYGATNVGPSGTGPYANETDGWVANGDLGIASAGFLTPGQNTINIASGERCQWGGMGKLELVLEIEGPIPLPVPYFSQKDPQWGSQEYDHANSLGPFYCGNTEIGKTIADCGCALTSAAMILKHYGVDKSPSGEPTNPGSLNNWLKNNDGYVGGFINWLAVANYSNEASKIFVTPKIEYRGTTKNFLQLNEELNNDRPTILEVRPSGGHFIVATGVNNGSYFINDPLSSDNLTLSSYGNTFKGGRRYTATNSDFSGILLTSNSTVEFLIKDSLGRKTGRDPVSGEIFMEIPNADYYLQVPIENDSIVDSGPSPNSGAFFFELLKPTSGEYQLLVNSTAESNFTLIAYDREGGVTKKEFSSNGLAEYELNYSPTPGSQIEVIQIVDTDIKPGSEPNSVNIKGNGVIPVAILTTPSFDATQVDSLSVKFGPNQAVETHNKGHSEDTDKDGDIDLILHFKTQETGIQNIDTQACLTGTSPTGILFEGCDLIQIVPK